MKALSSQVENNTYTFDEERCEKAMKILKSKLKNQSEDLTNNILYRKKMTKKMKRRLNQ